MNNGRWETNEWGGEDCKWDNVDTEAK